MTWPKLPFRVPPEMDIAIRQAAAEDERTVSDWMRRVVSAALKSRPKKYPGYALAQEQDSEGEYQKEQGHGR